MRHEIRMKVDGRWKKVLTFEELNEIIEEDIMRAAAMLDAASDETSPTELPGVGRRYRYWDGSWLYYIER